MLIIEMLGESGTPARSKMNITAMHTNYMLEKLGIMPKIVVIGTKAKITNFFSGEIFVISARSFLVKVIQKQF